MQGTRQAALKKRPAIHRSILSAALLLCVLSSALPADAFLSPFSLMPCCRGMMMGASGEGHGNSCPLHLHAPAKTPEPVQNDPGCGEGHDHHAKANAAPATQASLHDAHTHEQAQTEVEHQHGAGVSSQNTSQNASQQESAGAASLGKPCPSDCCGTVTSSFNGLRRTRHEAATTGDQHTHPHVTTSQRYTFSGTIKSASELRRSHPPRAPPTTLTSRTA